MRKPRISAPVEVLTLHFRREGEPLDGPAYAVTVGSREEVEPVINELMRTLDPCPVLGSFRLYRSAPEPLEVARPPVDFIVRVGAAPPAAPPPRRRRGPRAPNGQAELPDAAARESAE